MKMAELDIRPIWNPVYSSQYNLIEMAFAQVKAAYKKEKLRRLAHGIEFNHTKLHAPAEGFAAIMSLMFLGAFGLVLVVTKGFKGWAHDRELLTPAKIVSPYQPSPKKQRTAQHETIIVKHKAAPATVARPGQRYKQQTPGNSALT